MERVLCIFSVLVEVSDSQEAAEADFDQLDEISTAVWAALRAKFAHMEHVKTQDTVEFMWLDRPPGDEHINIHTCVICGRIGTDWMQPNTVHGVRLGLCEQGRFVCTVCRDENSTTPLGNGPSETQEWRDRTKDGD